MTILNLHMFVEIVKDMNLCVTAERLFTTQQGLSGHIKRLENYFGVSLFVRNPHLVLTEEGKLLMKEANNILETEQRLFTQFGTDNQYNFGSIQVACGMARSRYYMPRVISEFTSRYPAISINLHDENNFRSHDIFAEGKIDIVIGRKPKTAADMVAQPLVDLGGYIMMSDSIIRKSLNNEADEFIEKAKKGIEISEIPYSIPLAYAGSHRREPWICDMIPELKSRPKVHVERQNYDILVGICREGKVMIIISEMYVNYILNTFSPKFYEHIYFFPHFHNGKRFIEHETLSYDSSKYHPKYFDDFIDCVLHEFKNIQKDFSSQSPFVSQPAG